jgi:hypothetical protein
MYDPAAAAFSSMIFPTTRHHLRGAASCPEATISARKQRGSSGITGMDIDCHHIETADRVCRRVRRRNCRIPEVAWTSSQTVVTRQHAARQYA